MKLSRKLSKITDAVIFIIKYLLYQAKKKTPWFLFFYIIIFFLWNRGREVGNKKEKIEFFYNIIFYNR
jgi:chromate transport protein ChrA